MSSYIKAAASCNPSLLRTSNYNEKTATNSFLKDCDAASFLPADDSDHVPIMPPLPPRCVFSDGAYEQLRQQQQQRQPHDKEKANSSQFPSSDETPPSSSLPELTVYEKLTIKRSIQLADEAKTDEARRAIRHIVNPYEPIQGIVMERALQSPLGGSLAFHQQKSGKVVGSGGKLLVTAGVGVGRETIGDVGENPFLLSEEGSHERYAARYRAAAVAGAAAQEGRKAGDGVKAAGSVGRRRTTDLSFNSSNHIASSSSSSSTSSPSQQIKLQQQQHKGVLGAHSTHKRNELVVLDGRGALATENHHLTSSAMISNRDGHHDGSSQLLFSRSDRPPSMDIIAERKRNIALAERAARVAKMEALHEAFRSRIVCECEPSKAAPRPFRTLPEPSPK